MPIDYEHLLLPSKTNPYLKVVETTDVNALTAREVFVAGVELRFSHMKTREGLWRLDEAIQRKIDEMG